MHLIDDRFLLVIEIDVHHGIASDVESESFFERAVPSVHGVASTMSPTDHVWVVTSRLYNEVSLYGMNSLRSFAYVLPW